MPDKLSKLLEKLEAKFPEDQDVQAVMAEYEASYEPEEDMEDMDMDMPADEDMMAEADPMADMEGEAAPAEEAMDLEMLLAEDMEEDEEDLEGLEGIDMPPKKKKK